MSVSKRLRFEILRRDNFTCRYCGAEAPDVKLSVDHVVPVSLGGGDVPENLVAACVDCNSGKSSSSPDSQTVADVNEDASRWATAMEEVVKRRQIQLSEYNEVKAWFTSLWIGERGRPNYSVDENWAESIIRFLEMGLSRDEIEHLVDVTMKSKAKQKWRYFCGCCHTRVRQNAELAAMVMDETGDA